MSASDPRQDFATLQALEDVGVLAHRETTLAERISKVESAKRRLADLRPPDQAGQQRKQRLQASLTTKLAVLKEEQRLRTRLKTAPEGERRTIKEKLQGLRDSNWDMYGDNEVGDPGLKCIDRDMVNLALENAELRRVVARLNIEGDAEFRAKVIADLGALWGTPTGRRLLRSIAASRHRVTITPTRKPGGANGMEYDKNLYENRFWVNRSLELTPTRGEGRPGSGCPSTIHYNPDRTSCGPKPWETRPPAIGLGHELGHADQAARGIMLQGEAENDKRPDPEDPGRIHRINASELEAVGVPPYDGYEYSEAKLRREWSTRQPERPYY